MNGKKNEKREDSEIVCAESKISLYSEKYKKI